MPGYDLFGEASGVSQDAKYTSVIQIPLYVPKNKCPHPFELVDTLKAQQLSDEIKVASITEEEKRFLLLAAQRHHVFFYDRIADYYAHATPTMQRLMEQSALVIVDFNEAIAKGFVKLSSAITEQYLEETSTNG
jgi:hypothetical protein